MSLPGCSDGDGQRATRNGAELTSTGSALGRWRRGLAIAAVAWLASLAALPADARDAAPLVADPALEARVMHLAEELRCLVCQNETLAASQADLAVDLRGQIRQKLAAGKSETQVVDYLVARYGEFVRYRPAFDRTTALLWLGPFALLVVAGSVLGLTIRRRRADPRPAALDADEERRLAELFSGGSQPVAPLVGGSQPAAPR